MKIVEILGSPHGVKGNSSIPPSQVLLAAERAGAAAQPPGLKND